MLTDQIILGTVLVILLSLEAYRAIKQSNKGKQKSDDFFHPAFGRSPQARGATKR
jgi:hypothetical protein